MCGRFASTQTDAELLDVFRAVDVVGEQLPPSYNVAPTQPVRVVLERPPPEDTAVRRVRTARWGLVPSWARDTRIGSRLINARMETITTKPSFKAAACRRRAIVPSDGYFEWEKRDGAKVPHFLHGDGVLAMAGLYELWPNPDLPAEDPAKWMWSTVVLTTTATDAHGHIQPLPSHPAPRISGSLARPGPHRQRRRRRVTRVDPRTPPTRLRSQHQGQQPPQQHPDLLTAVP